MTRLHFLLVLVLLCSGRWAAGSDAVPGAVSTLARTGEVSCRPTLRYFCKNIHVGCSGRSATRTFPFTLRAVSESGGIEASAHGSVVLRNFRNGRVEWGADSGYVLLRPVEGAGYIKLLASGKYSFRHYSRGVAVMSYGHCG